MKYNFFSFYISMIYLNVVSESIKSISFQRNWLNTSTKFWMQQILNISQNELFYPPAVQFGVYRLVLILYNIWFCQWIFLYFNYSLLSPSSYLTSTQRNIHHTHKVATPPQLKLNKKTKFKSTLSHFLRWTSTTWNQKQTFKISK